MSVLNVLIVIILIDNFAQDGMKEFTVLAFVFKELWYFSKDVLLRDSN